MTTHFTTYIDLPATLKDLKALNEHLADVDPEEAMIDVKMNRDGYRLEVSYTNDEITKSTSSGDHLHFSGHVQGITVEEFSERLKERTHLRKSAEEFNNDDFD